MSFERQEYSGRNSIAPVGVDIYWYPKGVIDNNSRPRIGKIRWGRQHGTADLLIYPDTDGVLFAIDGVWHSSDPRRYDGIGNLSPGAVRNGVWEFAPWAWSYLNAPAKDADKQSPKKEKVGA